jgi:hypothetical protein
LAIAVGILLPIVEEHDGDRFGQELALLLPLVLPQPPSIQQLHNPSHSSSHYNKVGWDKARLPPYACWNFRC